jgi:threonine dehydratase
VEPVEVALKDVEAALPVVREVAIRTPTIPFSAPDGDGLFLKLESLQRTGSFKLRGVWNRLSRLPQPDRARGLVTISAGNHGLALAWAARRLGIPCLVRVPDKAVARKVDAIRAEGADVEPIPVEEIVRTFTEERWRAWPRTFIHPFAHSHTVAGAGTAGLEIAEDVPDARTVLVAVGGGGLAAGVAAAVKGLLPRARVYGVQAEGAAPLPTALATGRGHDTGAPPRTIADGIALPMTLDNMACCLSRLLDGCLIVTDDDVRLAMRRLAREAKVVAEPAGAVAFAAWAKHRDDLEAPVVAIVSGGNADPKLLSDVIA